jgi:deazaflavin-dependent oxidoreductase (nitroreductase family)
MLEILLWVLAAVVGLLVVGVLVVLVGMRTHAGVVLDGVRHFNHAVTNRLTIRKAGHPGVANGVIRHVGRTSGRAYETPIGPFPTADGFLVALPYGTRADWARNVLAAGRATLVFDGEEVAVGSPELVATAEVLDELPEGERRTLRTFGVEQCLRLRRVALEAPADR